MAGVDLYTVQRLGGWQTFKMVLDRRGAVLFDQPEDTQDTADPELAVSAMDRGAELADVGAGARPERAVRRDRAHP
jgi:hypothetical protein